MKKAAAKTDMPIFAFTASVVRDGKWYVGSVDEIPGVHSQGRTLAELEENLKDALALTIETRRDLARRERRGKARPMTVAFEMA